ncbi:MAG: hypothetical protein ACXVR1_17710 [Solirubrobacteraceae bacterium]
MDQAQLPGEYDGSRLAAAVAVVIGVVVIASVVVGALVIIAATGGATG